MVTSDFSRRSGISKWELVVIFAAVFLGYVLFYRPHVDREMYGRMFEVANLSYKARIAVDVAYGEGFTLGDLPS